MPTSVPELPEAPESEVILFKSAQRKAKEHPIRPDAARVVETTFLVDVTDAIDEAKKFLSASALEDGALLRMLDRGDRLVYAANKAYLSFRLERERWETQNEVIFASMRNAASKALEDEKASGQRAKQITDADVVARAALMFGDEWVDQTQRRRSAKLAEDDLKFLTERVGEKVRTLQAISSRHR